MDGSTSSTRNMGKEKLRLKSASDAEQIMEFLEETTEGSYSIKVGNEWNYITKLHVPERFTFRPGKPLTEKELKELSPPAYSHYEFLKNLTFSPPRKRYYTIQHGDIQEGKGTKTKGRITSREEAEERLTGTVLSSLWNWSYGKYLYQWEPITLFYYRKEEEKPEIIHQFKTPKEAVEWIGKERFREYVNEKGKIWEFLGRYERIPKGYRETA